MRVEAATKPPASDNVAYPGVSAGQTFGICFLYRPPTSWPGLVQQPDQIAASRDLSFFVSHRNIKSAHYRLDSYSPAYRHASKLIQDLSGLNGFLCSVKGISLNADY